MQSIAVTKNGTLWICEQPVKLSSVGLINGEDPTQFPTPLLLLQIALVSSLASLFHFLLKPFGLLSFLPQMLGGMVLGPSVLGASKKVSSKLFYARSLYLLDTYEAIGFLFLSFITSAQIDLGIVKRSGKMAVVSGFSLFLIPQVVCIFLPNFIMTTMKLPVEDVQVYLRKIARLESSILFQVIFTSISDLKMLNSEIGRLALSSSMICNLIIYALFVLHSFLHYSLAHGSDARSMILATISQGASFFALVAVFRAILLWMEKRMSNRGKQFEEWYLRTICVMVLFTGFYAETIGLTYLSAAVALGFATPTRIMLELDTFKKISCFVDSVLMPCFLIAVGRRVNVFTLCMDDLLVTEFATIVVHIAKFTAALIPSLYYKIPFSHAVSFGLIINIQGIFNVQIFKRSLNSRKLNDEAFSYMVIIAMVHSALYASLVKKIYQPTSKYIAYQRRTIQHLQPRDAEFRILACFHEQEAVPPILNLLEVSNPTRGTPISVFALNLEELVDQSIPVLFHHRLDKKLSMETNNVDRVINAFHLYEKQNQGVVSVQCFTAVAPYATMHDDVCSLALAKETNLVIIGLNKEDNPLFRRVSRNVLENAPCSVAIMYNRGELPDFRSIIARSLNIKICVLFLGGSDDREALAYGARMVEHPSVNLCVLRLVDENNLSRLGEMIERNLDLHSINRFRTRTITNQKVELREVRITEARDLLETLREMGKEYHLMIVGIRHDEDSPALEGLSEWSEMEELGVIGDLVASPDLGIRASVLAVQQMTSRDNFNSTKGKSKS